MREWIKTLSQALAGTSFLVAAVVYWMEGYRANQQRTTELRGTLLLVVMEVGRNERALELLIREPHRLFNSTERPLDTRVWDQNNTRIARLLTDQTLFTQIARYYADIQLIKESHWHEFSDKEGMEDSQRSVKACKQEGSFVENQIYRFIAYTLGDGIGK